MLTINSKILKEEKCVKYLGLYIDSNLKWGNQVNYIKKKVNRSIGILSKICYYVNTNTLINLYYSLVYPFFIYGLIVWGNTYNSTLNPLYFLQKRALRIMTFSKFHEHSSPLFKQTRITKFHDLVVFLIAIFVHKYHNNLLPTTFETFFVCVNEVHDYNTRLSSKISYSIPRIRTNYEKFNIRFQGVRVWNSIDENLKSRSPLGFKKKLKIYFIDEY